MMKQKSTVWRVLAILLVAFLWGGNQNAYAVKKMWAKLESLDGTSTASSLTFYYTEKGTLGDFEYEMNTGKTTPAWLDNRRRIQKVVFDKSFADARPTSCYKWFYDCYNIKTIEGIENLNTSEVTDMSYMFSYLGTDSDVAVNLDLSHFDTSKVTDMSNMFRGCYNTLTLDVSHFNTSKVTNMSEMFRCCNSITSLDLSNFDTSSVTDMSGMFSYSETLSYLNLSSFNTSHVQNMDCVFKNMPALKEVDITSFSTESVTSVREMFQTVNDPYFKGTSILEAIWASDKFNVTNLSSEKSENMFEGCTSLKEGEMPFDPKVVDKTYATATGGYLAKHVRPWAKLEDGTLTFYYSNKGQRGDGEYAMNVGQNAPGWSDKKGDITKVVFDKSFADVRPTTCYFWFYRCENLKTIEGIENLNTSKVTNMSRMFRDCYSLTSLDLSNFDTSNVTDMSEMFYDCWTSIDVSSFNTSKVVDMTSMFWGCGSTTLDLSNFDTSNVTSMFCMFYGCDHIKELDISSFNTSNVTSMFCMFENCSNLTTIYASDKFVLDKVTSSDSKEMFKGCTKLKGDISCDGVNNIDKTYAKINGGYFTDAATAMTSWTDIANGTLTFRYGARRRELEAGKEFKLNVDNAAPDWLSSSEAPNITKVVFCKAFANAHPTTCYGWFNGLKNLKTIKGIGNLKTSEVTNMNSMFSGCSSLTSLNCLFNTEKVTDMGKMFKGCSSLASLYISYFNTKAVTEMTEMFRGCSSLKSLNLTSFNTQEQKVKFMNQMFRDCSQLKNIYVSETFSAYNAGVYNIFENCPAYLNCPIYQYAKVRANNNSDYSPVYYRIRPYVNINAQAPYGTLCVPFGSTLTEGSYTGFDKLYRVKGADINEGTITLEESTAIEPGVAYVYRRDLPEDATASIITFTVDDTKESVTDPQNDGNLLKGTFLEIFAPISSYLLQSDGNFHPVPFTARMLRVPEYRAYLSLSSLASEGGEAGAKAYRMVFEDGETTGIGSISADGEGNNDGIDDNADQRPTPIYDLMGRRVNAPQKGGIYIVNGKKVMF